MVRGFALLAALGAPEAVVEGSPAGGLSLLSVVEPAGAACEARPPGGEALRWVAPGTVTLEAGARYAVRCALPEGGAFEATLEAAFDRHQVVRIVTPAPAAPAPPPTVSEAELEALLGALRRAPLSAEKQAALAGLAPEAKLSVAQVDRLLGELVHGADKRAAVEALLPRLVDLEQAGRLARRFEFSADRAWLQARLAALAPAGKR